MSDAPQPPSAPVSPVDSSSQALAEALRSSFAIVKYVMGALFILFLFSGVFKVEPQEKALILRLGKPVNETRGEQALLGSGLHLAFPYPIDEVVKIPISSFQKLTTRTAWYYLTPEQIRMGDEGTAYPTSGINPAQDGYALTGDGNIVHIQASLNYHIEDPIRCVFEFANGTNAAFSLAGVSNAVANALDNALIHTAARYKMDDLRLKDAVGFQDAVTRRLVQLVQQQKLGIAVDNCSVISREPRQLKQVFDNVLIAGQKSDSVIKDARSYEDQVLSKARSEATNRINSAANDSARTVQDVTAFAKSFSDVLPYYQSNPDLFLQQRLVKTLGNMFTNATDKMLLVEQAGGKPLELRLLLNKDPLKPKPGAATP